MLCVPALHPAYLIRSSDNSKGEARFRDTTLNDLRRAFSLLERRPLWDERVIWQRDGGRLVNLFPTADEVVAFLIGLRGQLTAVDVETTGEHALDCQLICIGFASERGQAMCVPILNAGGSPYWSPADWNDKVAPALRYVLGTMWCRKLFHNGPFDTLVLWAHGMPVVGYDEDCYAAETEFLTARGWLRYDDVTDDDLLATVAANGEMEFQRPTRRVKKPYCGPMYCFETIHTRAVVTANHRMLCAPYWRRDGREGPWGFTRAGEMLAGTPDTYRIRAACEPSRTESVRAQEVAEATLFGLFVADGCFLWKKAADPESLFGIMISQEEGGRAEHLLRGPLSQWGFTQRKRVHDEAWRSKPCTEIRWELIDRPLARRFLAWTGRYSKDRRVPPHLFQANEIVKRAFLAGLFAGDGSDVGPSFVYRTASRGLADDVQALALSIGKTATIGRNGDVWGVWLAHDAPTTELLGARLKGPTRRYPRENVTEIDYDGEIVCFTVPNETLVTRCGGKPAFYGNTIFLHHVLDAELPHGLGYVASICLEVRHWKDDVKGKEAWLNLERTNLFSYNVRDVLCDVRAFPILMAEVRRLGLEPLYREELQNAKIMAKGTVRGIAVDFQRRDDPTLDDRPFKLDKKGQPTTKPNPDYGLPRGLGPKLRIKRDAALAILKSIAGHPAFNPGSIVQLRWLLYNKLAFPIVRRTEKTQAPATDKDAMVLLALHAESEAQIQVLRNLARWRQAAKMLGTWVEGLTILSDGRLHIDWKVFGTVTGRYSSSPNGQNLGPAIKRIFKAGPGCKFVSIDLSQAEMRVMGYLSGDPELARIYREGINVHTFSASLLFQVCCPPDAPADNTNPQTVDYTVEKCREILGLDYTTFPAPPADKWKIIRTLAKNFGFGHNYGAEAETLYDTLRSKRDPETGDLMFEDLTLELIEICKIQRERMHPAIVRWWTTVVEETRARGYYQCPISGRIRWFRGGFKRNEMLNCVDAETEALTRRGWVKGFELRRDDILLTKNAATGALEWQEMTDLRLFPDHEGPLLEFRSKSFSAVSTPDHRWLVRDRNARRDMCCVSQEIVETQSVHRTGTYGGIEVFSDDLVELCGWFLTDGSYRELRRKRTPPRPIVRLYQSQRANPALVTRIDALLARLTHRRWRSGPSKRTQMVTWDLPAKWSRWLHETFPDRGLTPDFLAKLSGRQARHLVEVMVLGDGHNEENEDGRITKTCFTAGVKRNAEMFQALCVLAGIATSLHERDMSKYTPKSEKLLNVPKMGTIWTVTLLRRKYAQVTAAQRRAFTGKVPVWCPIVPNTYFVARREGHVFITGNTPIQMMVGSWMNKIMPKIDADLERYTDGTSVIVSQVHDALTAESLVRYTGITGEIMTHYANQPFDLPGYPGATLPADAPTVGDYLDQI